MTKEIRPEVWQKAIEITSFFEGAQYPSGNFDDQYLSMGTLQWNLGQNTLQPILLDVFTKYGADKWQLEELLNAINTNNIDFYKSMSGYGKKLIEPWYSRLYNLNNSQEFIESTANYFTYYFDTAIKICESFGITTDRSFCLAFDISVQCGSLNFYDMVETDYFDRLTSMAEVTAMKCGKWADDVRKRKMAIVRNCDQGRGWSNTIFDDKNMYIEEEEYMNKEDIRAELLIPNITKWGPEQVRKSIENGILQENHDASEIVQMGTLCAMFNNLLEAITEEINKK